MATTRATETTKTTQTTTLDTPTSAAAAIITMPAVQVTSQSLPHKKRKASNASSMGSSQSGGAAATQAKLREERRLPRKKRKEAHVNAPVEQNSSVVATLPSVPAPTRTGEPSSVPPLPNLLPDGESGGRSRKGSFLDFLDDSAPANNNNDATHLKLVDGPTALAASTEPGSEKEQTHDSLLGAVPGKPQSIGDNDTAKTEPGASSALDHLDALQSTNSQDDVPQRKDSHDQCDQKPAATAAATLSNDNSNNSNKPKPRSNSGSSTAEESFASSGHRLLMEAIMMKDSTTGGNSNSTSAVNFLSTASERSGIKLEHLPLPAPLHALRDRLDSFPPPLPPQLQHQSASTTSPAASATAAAVGRDRLDSLGFVRDRFDSFAGGRDRLESLGFARDRLDSFALQRDRLDSFAPSLSRDRLDSFAARERLESWGGMSDLSMPPVVDASIMATAMAAASNLQQGHLLLDDSHNPNGLGSTSAAAEHQRAAAASAIPSRISLQRDRFNSIASLSEFSASGALVIDGIDLNGDDLQAFVAAAMASVGDQISDLAGAMEHVVAAAATGSVASMEDDEESSAVSAGQPMIGVAGAAALNERRPRSWSACSSLGKISVDLEAVHAAVAAAEAASGSMSMMASTSSTDDHNKMAPPLAHKVSSLSVKPKAAGGGRSRVARRALPLNKGPRTASNEDDDNYDDEDDEDTISNKRNTRKNDATPKAKRVPLKKRGKRNSPPPPSKVKSCSTSTMKTPKISNRSIAASAGLDDVLPPAVTSSSCDVVTSLKRPPARSSVALEKWESMFSALIDFREERRALESTTGSQPLDGWVWDGNVPTNYKTQDGKPLGRWINNQRSAYAKGQLKEDRQQRLLDAGLKWSVVKTKNPWDYMLSELSIYISEQTARGVPWDGNVPTHYVIKKRPGDSSGDDKNLGRWINRQRSNYHSGRLRKDRQEALENLGLKWSMQFTTSWEDMFETLRDYVEEQKAKNGGTWDGNVPTQYRTQHTPSRSLGRWVNRQRTRRTKQKLKQEYVGKLTALGMVWSMHKPSGGDDNDADDDDDGDDFVEYHKTDDAGDKSNGNDKNSADKNEKENTTKVSTTSDKANEPPQPQTVSSGSGPVSLPNELNLDIVVGGETAMI